MTHQQPLKRTLKPQELGVAVVGQTTRSRTRSRMTSSSCKSAQLLQPFRCCRHSGVQKMHFAVVSTSPTFMGGVAYVCTKYGGRHQPRPGSCVAYSSLCRIVACGMISQVRGSFRLNHSRPECALANALHQYHSVITTTVITPSIIPPLCHSFAALDHKTMRRASCTHLAAAGAWPRLMTHKPCL